MKRVRRLIHFYWLTWLLARVMAGCAGTTSAMTPTAATPGSVCAPTDQDRYVYQPTRLQVMQACVYITGVVEEVERDGVDGDITLLIRPDPPYEGLLTDRNREAQDGNLVVEPVCQLQPLLPAAIAVCAADRVPCRGPLPHLGRMCGWRDAMCSTSTMAVGRNCIRSTAPGS